MTLRFAPRAMIAAVACLATAAPSLADEFSELRVLIELNATDGDAGLHVYIDGDGWRELTLAGPGGDALFRIAGAGGVADQGLTENFFESAEPTCEELPLAAFLERFPAGVYVADGLLVDGGEISGEAALTHALPGAPKLGAPNGEGGVDPAAATLSWEAGDDLGACPADGADLTPPGEVALFGYEVIVLRETPAPQQSLVLGLGPDARSVALPPQFLSEGGVYKFEVVAIEARDEERGNQTVSEGFFCTAPIAAADCALPE